MDISGRVLADRYRLDALVAEGGMGQVWSARHLTLDTVVAVKLMSAFALGSEELRARFAREAKAAAQLRSPHVVHIFDYGVSEGTPYLVMEMLDGEDLTALITRRKRLPLPECCRLVAQAAKGLTAAHKAGFIHRDVKPGNLFLAREQGETILKVLDFGIAKSSDDGPKMTRTDVVLGSPYYMSPEQLMSQPLDARSDTWSLGVVAFLLITGVLPFSGMTALEVADKIRSGSRPRVADVDATLPSELEVFFDRALAVDRDERLATPAELSDALCRACGERPLIGPPSHAELGPASSPTPASGPIIATTTPGELAPAARGGTAPLVVASPAAARPLSASSFSPKTPAGTAAPPYYARRAKAGGRGSVGRTVAAVAGAVCVATVVLMGFFRGRPASDSAPPAPTEPSVVAAAPSAAATGSVASPAIDSAAESGAQRGIAPPDSGAGVMSASATASATGAAGSSTPSAATAGRGPMSRGPLPQQPPLRPTSRAAPFKPIDLGLGHR